ncbi:hypothetical protein RhiTH_007957 [Rhizoctonia solani]
MDQDPKPERNGDAKFAEMDPYAAFSNTAFSLQPSGPLEFSRAVLISKALAEHEADKCPSLERLSYLDTGDLFPSSTFPHLYQDYQPKGYSQKTITKSMSYLQNRRGSKPKPPNPVPEVPYPISVLTNGLFRQESGCDKLASDRIGEELKHDASIWRLYEEEVKEYDTEFTRERNENLNNMLLFATLFSAIVTAFIIESTNLLEQDSSEVSEQLLLLLVQSQQRIELGLPNSTPSIFERREFTPSATARLINVLWFGSLMISLGAAVIALLAQEWLRAFTLYRTRHAHDYALERQSRFKYLRAAVAKEACPYKSQLSSYLRLALTKWFTLKKYFPASETNPSHIEPRELDLLDWLFGNSSDPTLKSYVTQALAGLRSRGLNIPTIINNKAQISDLQRIYREKTEELAPLFSWGAYAINELRMAPTKGRNSLALCGGSNAARLAIAISEIFPYALVWKLPVSEEATHSYGNSQEAHMQARSKILSTERLHQMQPQASSITEEAFDVIDSIWAETSPALAPSAYAYLAIAELKILRHILAFKILHGKEPPAPLGHSIDMRPPTTQVKTSGSNEIDLRGRYCIVLARTALVIKSSLEYLNSKGSQAMRFAITALLKEATELVKEGKLHAVLKSSFRGAFNVPKEQLSLKIAEGDSRTRQVTYQQRRQNFELVEALLELRGDSRMNALHLEDFQVAAWNLLVVFFPAHLQQGIKSLVSGGRLPAWVFKQWQIIPLQDTPYTLHVTNKIIVEQYIALTSIAIAIQIPSVKFITSKSLIKLDDLVQDDSTLLLLILELLDSESEYKTLLDIWIEPYIEFLSAEMLESWIYTILEININRPVVNDRSLRRLCWHIVRLLGVATAYSNRGLNVFHRLVTTHSPLIEDSETVPEHPGLQMDDIMQLVQVVSDVIRLDGDTKTRGLSNLIEQVRAYISACKPCKTCLENFTEGPGFDILIKASQIETARKDATQTIATIVSHLSIAGLGVEGEVVHSLFKAIRCVFNSDNDVPLEFYLGALFQLRQLISDYGASITREDFESIKEGLKKHLDSVHVEEILDEIQKCENELLGEGHTSDAASDSGEMPRNGQSYSRPSRASAKRQNSRTLPAKSVSFQDDIDDNSQEEKPTTRRGATINIKRMSEILEY